MNLSKTLRTLRRGISLRGIVVICALTALPSPHRVCRADEPGDKAYAVKLAAVAHVGEKSDFSSAGTALPF